MKKRIDVNITGQMGLYRISHQTRRGRAWCKKHLSKGERTVIDGVIICEGGDRCRAIVAGMVADKLRVEVNGVDMTGYGKED